MIRRGNQAGFTLIELMIVVAIIAIIASIAIPRLMSARLAANESAAIATLRSLSSAQAQIQSSAAIDTDADGAGEYGYFAELAGTVPLRVSNAGVPGAGAVGLDELRPAVLSAAFGNVADNGLGQGIVTRSGYNFQMWLPGPTGGGITGGVAEAPAGGAGAFPDPDNCEVLWACYAWPMNYNTTGNRVFFVNQEGDLLQMQNRIANPYDGTANMPLFDAAFTVGGDMGSPLAIGGLVANDGNVWTPVN